MPRHRMKFHVRRPVAIMRTEEKPAMCPYCGAKFDAVTGVSMNGTEPMIEAGDHSICAYCRNLMRYDGKVFTQVTPEEAAQVMAGNSLWRALQDMRRSTYTPKPDKVQ